MHILHTHSFTVHLALTRRIWLEITMFFAAEQFPLLSAFYDWYCSVVGYIARNVNWCWSLLTVQKVFLVITDWKQTHRRTFQVFQYYTKLQLKSKLPVGKNVKALSAFLNVPAVRKIQQNLIKRKLSQSREGYSFHYVWLTLVCFGSWTCGTSGTSGPKVHDVIIFNSQWGARIWFAYE